MKRLLPLLVLAALLVGCGGTQTAGSTGAGASVVPASVAAYVTVDTDLSSSQWSKVDSLLSKFPAKDLLLTKLRQSFEQDTKLSWENDVKPALGNELDLAVVDVAPGTAPSADVVALTQPKDKGKFDALVKKLNDEASTSTSNNTTLVTETSNGWTLVSDSQSKLDAFLQAAANGKLADDKIYQGAMGKLDADALVKAYANGAKVGTSFRAALRSMAATGGNGLTRRLGSFKTASAEVVAQGDALVAKGFVDGTSAAASTDYTPKLLDVVPAGALAVVSFHGGPPAAGAAPAAPNGGALPQIPGMSPLLGALRKLGPLFRGENVLYVAQGFPIPEVSLVAEPRDPAQASTAVKTLLKSIRPLLGGRFQLYTGADGGRVYVSTSKNVVNELRGGGQKLADDSTFQAAKQATGMPDTTSGFVYVNLKDAVPFVEGLASLTGSKVPADADQNLRHLRTLLAYASAKGSEARFTAYLSVG